MLSRLLHGSLCEQVAFQQADYVAWNVWAAINGRPLLPFKYQHLGDMMSLGSINGAVTLPLPVPSQLADSLRVGWRVCIRSCAPQFAMRLWLQQEEEARGTHASADTGVLAFCTQSDDQPLDML